MCNLLFNISLNEFNCYYCFNHERRKPKISLQFTNMLFPKTKYAPSIFGIQYTSCCRACFESLLDCFLRCVSLSSFTITTAFNSWNDFSQSELGCTQEMPPLTTRWQSRLGEQPLPQAPRRRLIPQAGDRETSLVQSRSPWRTSDKIRTR